jgi:hypothetical protein
MLPHLDYTAIPHPQLRLSIVIRFAGGLIPDYRRLNLTSFIYGSIVKHALSYYNARIVMPLTKPSSV